MQQEIMNNEKKKSPPASFFYSNPDKKHLFFFTWPYSCISNTNANQTSTAYMKYDSLYQPEIILILEKSCLIEKCTDFLN